MASYAKKIGDAIVAKILNVQGSPVTVKQRKDNSILGRETPPIVVVTIESEQKVGRAFEGVIFKEYAIIVGFFRKCLADISTELDITPEFILRTKQALDITAFVSVPEVWDVDLADNPEWEHQDFGKGMEVSRFGLLVKTSEPQNG